MIVRPMEFGMIQQQNTVSQVRHNEDVRPMVEQQTTAVQLQKDIHTRAEQVNHKEDSAISSIAACVASFGLSPADFKALW